MIAGFRRLYGANPLHLIAHLAAFAVAFWAIGQILDGGTIINWIVWFIGAAILHDLVLLPLYSTLDRGLGIVTPRRRAESRRVPLINHLRAPAVIAGILLIVYFPLILGLSSRNYLNDTGHHLAGYTRNWLLITVGLFLISALVYAVRVRRRRPRRPRRPPVRKPPPAREHPGG
jgi:Na+/melibiose symporter-like transporter